MKIFGEQTKFESPSFESSSTTKHKIVTNIFNLFNWGIRPKVERGSDRRATEIVRLSKNASFKPINIESSGISSDKSLSFEELRSRRRKVKAAQLNVGKPTYARSEKKENKRGNA